MYVEKVLDFLFQLMKNGSENKTAVFIFLFSVLKYSTAVNVFSYFSLTHDIQIDLQ